MGESGSVADGDEVVMEDKESEEDEEDEDEEDEGEEEEEEAEAWEVERDSNHEPEAR